VYPTLQKNKRIAEQGDPVIYLDDNGDVIPGDIGDVPDPNAPILGDPFAGDGGNLGGDSGDSTDARNYRIKEPRVPCQPEEMYHVV
jgi:hypothetical protein